MPSLTLLPSPPILATVEEEFSLADEMRHRKYLYVHSSKTCTVSMYCPNYLVTLTSLLAEKIGNSYSIRNPGIAPMMSASIVYGVSLLQDHYSIVQLDDLQKGIYDGEITDTRLLETVNQWRDSFSTNFSITDPTSSGKRQRNTYIGTDTKIIINELNGKLGISMSHIMIFAWMLTMLNQPHVSSEYKEDLKGSLEPFFDRVDSQCRIGSVILQSARQHSGPKALESFLKNKSIRQLTTMFKEKEYTRQKLISLIYQLVNDEEVMK